ncbi:MAG: hypothetical protein AB1765_10985, partial [Candidatus Hydrogenedentota bacterium]
WAMKQEIESSDGILIEIANKMINHFERLSSKITTRKYVKEKILYITQCEIISEGMDISTNAKVRKIIETLMECTQKLLTHWFGSHIEMSALEKIVCFYSADYAFSFSIKFLEAIINETMDNDIDNLYCKIKIIPYVLTESSKFPNYEKSRVALSKIPSTLCTPNCVVVLPETYEILDPQFKRGLQKVYGDLDTKTGSSEVFYRYSPLSEEST